MHETTPFRRWNAGIALAVLVAASCGRAGQDVTSSDAADTCHKIERSLAELGVIWGINAFFRADQLIEPSAEGTYVAVLRVGDVARLEARASVVGSVDCSGIITGVTWRTSDSQVATAQVTGAATALLAALAPGEVTLTAEATFLGGRVHIPYVFNAGPSRVRRIRVVAK
jgi:hypothetical protein